MTDADGFDQGAATDRVGARLEAEALIVDVDGWEGPLDLLLTLARTQKVDLLQASRCWRWPSNISASSRKRASCGSSWRPTIW